MTTPTATKNETGAEARLNPWRRVRAGWYRSRTPDSGLWLHVIERAPRDWSLIPTTDEHSAQHPTRFGGYETKNEAQGVALAIYGQYSTTPGVAK